VIGWLLGYRIASVRLASKGKYGGWTDFGRCTQGLRSSIFDARRVYPEIEAALEIVISLAGGRAEELIGAAVFDDYDRLAVAEILRTSLGCPEGSARSRRIMRPLISICGKYVHLHRPQIDALVEALLADGIVKQDGIRRILGRRTMPPRSVIFEVVSALERAELEEQRSVAVLVGR